MNSKEENSSDFCPNYAQEFGLWIDGGAGGAAPRWCVIEPEKTGAHSAGARSAAKNQ